MKKLMYLLLVGVMFAFTACTGGEDETCADDCAKECCTGGEDETCADDCAKECCTGGEDETCADDCAKACCLGCKATEGDKKCIKLEDGTMPCCAVSSDDEGGETEGGETEGGETEGE